MRPDQAPSNQRSDMRSRDLRRMTQLIATLFFGLSVLALLSLVSVQMATHYLEGVAERSIRQVFTEGIATKDGVSYHTLCQNPESDPESLSRCDPLVAKGERSLRSVSCGGQGFLGLVGRQWACVARFADGSSLEVHVGLGLGRRDLELVLPFRETGA